VRGKGFFSDFLKGPGARERFCPYLLLPCPESQTLGVQVSVGVFVQRDTGGSWAFVEGLFFRDEGVRLRRERRAEGWTHVGLWCLGFGD